MRNATIQQRYPIKNKEYMYLLYSFVLGLKLTAET